MSDNYEDLFNADVFDQHGTRVGPVGQVYLDDQTGAATWATVKTGLFGLKETFVPLAQAVVDGQKLTVPYDAQLIKDAPRVDPDKHLDAAEEAELYVHYGITNVMAAELDDPAAQPLAEDTTPVLDEVAEPVEASADETAPLVDEAAEQVVVTESVVSPTEARPEQAADLDLYGEVKEN